MSRHYSYECQQQKIREQKCLNKLGKQHGKINSDRCCAYVVCGMRRDKAEEHRCEVCHKHLYYIKTHLLISVSNSQ